MQQVLDQYSPKKGFSIHVAGVCSTRFVRQNVSRLPRTQANLADNRTHQYLPAWFRQNFPLPKMTMNITPVKTLALLSNRLSLNPFTPRSIPMPKKEECLQHRYSLSANRVPSSHAYIAQPKGNAVPIYFVRSYDFTRRSWRSASQQIGHIVRLSIDVTRNTSNKGWCICLCPFSWTRRHLRRLQRRPSPRANYEFVRF